MKVANRRFGFKSLVSLLARAEWLPARYRDFCRRVERYGLWDYNKIKPVPWEFFIILIILLI
jgi:hypothetical protein